MGKEKTDSEMELFELLGCELINTSLTLSNGINLKTGELTAKISANNTPNCFENDIVFTNREGKEIKIGVYKVTKEKNDKYSFLTYIRLGDFELRRKRSASNNDSSFEFREISKPGEIEDTENRDYVKLDLGDNPSIEVRLNRGRIQFKAGKGQLALREETDLSYFTMYYIGKGKDKVNKRTPRYYFLKSSKNNENFEHSQEMMSVVVENAKTGDIRILERGIGDDKVYERKGLNLLKNSTLSFNRIVGEHTQGKEELLDFIKRIKKGQPLLKLLLRSAFFSKLDMGLFSINRPSEAKEKPNDSTAVVVEETKSEETVKEPESTPVVGNIEDQLFALFKLGKKGERTRLKKNKSIGVNAVGIKAQGSVAQEKEEAYFFDVPYNDTIAQLKVTIDDGINMSLSKDTGKIFSLGISKNHLTYSCVVYDGDYSKEVTADYKSGDNPSCVYNTIITTKESPNLKWIRTATVSQKDTDTVSVNYKDSLLNIDHPSEHKDTVSHVLSDIEDTLGGFRQLKSELRCLPFGKRIIADILSNYNLTSKGLDAFIKRREK